MSNRKLIVFLLLICMVAVMPFAVYAEEAAQTQETEAVTTSETVADGFVDNGDGTYSYYLNGEMVTSAVVLHTDGCYYGFNYNGIMYTSTSFSIYNSEKGMSLYYRAKESGALYVNEWYYPYPDDNPYYCYHYGEGGVASSGLAVVDGVQYYFYTTGEMARGTTVTIDSVIYVVDSYGTVTPLEGDGWHLVGEDYYYVLDGALCEDDVYLIDGQYYMFDYNGVMCTNTTRDYYDDELSRWVYYRAKDNGVLYVNEWYIPDPENDPYYRWYYGEGGKAPSGLAEVDGVLYYFYSDGQMRRNSTVEVDGVNYVIDECGTLYALESDGWHQIGENWYYVLDGVMCENDVYLIDGQYYMFNGNGVMLTSTLTDFYDDELGRWVYYRSKESGVLYVNEWYIPDPNHPYYCFYYGEGGKAPSGLAEVDGVQYYFWSDGQLRTNGVVEVDGLTYVIDECGTLYALEGNGWHQVGENWYYVLDGAVCKNDVYLIDGQYYMFGSNGVMLTDTATDFYDEDLGRWVYYRAKESGVLYVNEWYYPDQENDPYYRYYYGEGGKAPEGLTEVDGVQYYFYSSGQVARNTSFEIDGVTYVADECGTIHSLEGDGWHQIGEYWYYVLDGAVCKNGVYQIDGQYYMFDSSGQMLTDTATDFYDDELGRWVYYRAKESGVLYVNEWYIPNPEDNPYYRWYYGEGGKAPEGLTEVDGVLYYFSYNGRMYRNTSFEIDGVTYVADDCGVVHSLEGNGWHQVGEDWYYVLDGVVCKEGIYLIGGQYYGFSYEGRMYEDQSFDFYDDEQGRWVYYRAKESGVLYVNEWYYPYPNSTNEWDRNTRYYYGEGGKAPYGIVEVDGVLYYFYGDGQVGRDDAIETENGCYYADSQGNLSVLSEGWNHLNGQSFYVQDGKFPEYGVNEIDGELYFFFGNGSVMKNGTTNYWDDELGRSVYYRAREDGTLYVNTWYMPNENNPTYCWYYGEGGKSAYGMQTVDGVTYYFRYNGRLQTEVLFQQDDVYYVSDENGVVTNVSVADGWIEVGDNWYYISNGELYTNGIYTIGGSLYGFDSDGIMFTNGSFEMYDDESGDWHYYRAKKSGVLYVNEWAKFNGDWYYYGEGGKAARGLQTVDGTQYYFDSDGMMNVDALIRNGSEYYVADANGILTKVTLVEGWNQFNGDWYYVVNGEPVSGKIVKVGGAYYAFGYDFKMLANTTFEMYDDEYGDWIYGRAKASGALYVNEWYKTSYGEWYYYGEGGRAASGLHTIGSAKYYFEWNGYMLYDCVISYDGANYYADKDGVLHTLNEGWTQIGSDWFYVKDGEICSSEICEIGGTLYYFGYNGKMVNDGFYEARVYNEEEGYSYWTWVYAKASGALYRNSWLYSSTPYTSNQGWVYFDNNGCMVREEVMKIGGYYYYFGHNGLAVSSDVVCYDGVTYIFDANTYGTVVPDGWLTHPESGEWMYVKDGVLATGLMEIDGKTYAFYSNGEMITDEIYHEDSKWYMINSSGVVVTTTGWYQLNGSYYYVTADGSLHEGWLTIGGSSYWMDPEMLHSTIFTDPDDGACYVVNGSGICTKVTGDGLYDLGGSMVYVEGGKKVTKAWRQINGAWYYFRSSGYMCSGGTYEIDGTLYLFDQDGKMYTGGWLMLYGDYYYSTNGEAAVGLQTIDGKQYYFHSDGYMAEARAVNVDGEWYVVGTDGAVLGKAEGDGWKKFDGNWYYVMNGELLTDALVTIDSSLYHFDYTGIMSTNEVVWYDGPRYFNASGAAVSGWYKTGEGWIYADPDTKELCNGGKYVIGGSTYYFNGYYMLTGTFRWNEEIITCNSSGAVVDSFAIPDGWTYVQGDALYYVDGEPYTGWLGDRYIRNGYMLMYTIDEVDGGYRYFDVYGKTLTSGWLEPIEGFWILAKADGTLYNNEWAYVGGTYYYFMDFMMVYGGVYEIDGTLYEFDDDGKYLGVYEVPETPSLSDGWQLVDGEYYYYHAGEAVVGRYYIDGNWYYFDWDGVMVSDGLYYDQVDDNGWFYYDANGVMGEYTGWKTLNGYQHYFNTDHSVRTGWLQDGSKLYYMTIKTVKGSDGVYRRVNSMRTGYMAYDYELYYFAPNGVCQGKIVKQDGWYQVDSDWYYFEDGKLTYDHYKVIDGCGYIFEQGLMMKNTIVWTDGGQIYVNSNGCHVKTEGWYLLENEYWIYVNDQGYLCNGVWEIDGKLNYFQNCVWVGTE